MKALKMPALKMPALKIMGGALALAVFAQPALAQPAAAEQPQSSRSEILPEKIVAASVPRIVAQVNGLVCDFCAQALKKVFGKEAAVDDVNVNLNKGVVEITLKPNQQISDARVAELIRKSGYSLVSTTREGGA